MKAASIMAEMGQYPDTFEQLLVHTGQHYDDGMSAVFFRELDIPEPAHNLGVGSGSHGWQTGQMLMRIEEVLLAEKTNWMLLLATRSKVHFDLVYSQ